MHSVHDAADSVASMLEPLCYHPQSPAVGGSYGKLQGKRESALAGWAGREQCLDMVSASCNGETGALNCPSVN